MEFHQLREYRQGDPQRAIDWKATSRTQRLIAREYEEEKDQRVLLVIDCGRRMAAKDDDLSHFDHALNAGLLRNPKRVVLEHLQRLEAQLQGQEELRRSEAEQRKK